MRANRIALAGFATFLAACPPALLVSPARADMLQFRSEYKVTALGLTVGSSRFETTLDAGAYAMSSSFRARGLAALFQKTHGTLSVRGRIDGKAIVPERFVVDYVSGGDGQHTEIGFSGRAVTRTVNQPEVRKKSGWIALRPGDLKNALDPISAALVAAGSPGEVCNRTIRYYDGAMRADLQLSHLRVVPFSTTGFKGDAVTCLARFVPVSGYRGSKREIAWMRDKGRIEISFAPIAGTELYAPVKATVATQIGPVRIHATRFELSRP